jgi:transposase
VSIVGGLDVHRRQITFDWVDRATGQAQQGQITPATREGLGRWLAQLPDHHGAFAVEACTGWRFVVEELQAAGWQAYLAEPAETAMLRGPKRRAKTDRTDAQLLPGAAGTRPPAAGVDPTGAPTGCCGCWCGCVRPWSISAPPSSSGCTPCCSTTACPAPTTPC